MCGIAGFVTTRPAADASAILARMAASLEHRGPDDYGYHCDGRAFLAHRRLSIVDLAGGHQPMANEDGSKWVVYNGEIFNHAALRPELEAAGHRYHTHSDTEAILHGYEEYGDYSTTKFNGMFAYALWDKTAQTLYCARDRHGIKPFYYYWDGTLFAFASEIKALLEHPDIAARPNEAVFAEYLTFGFVSGSESMFKGIHKLPPAHILRLEWRGDRFELSMRQYWEPPVNASERGDEREWIEECRRRLEGSVQSRLMADVPLGMFLSGGLDSSAIAAVMRRHFDGPLKTFSVGYQETEYGELPWARRVAERIGTEHHEAVVSFEDFFGALPKLVWHEDEPICFSSSVPLYFLSKLAREHVKVVLTGEGSDELFGGYERYRYHLINKRIVDVYGMVPAQVRRGVQGILDSPAIPSLSLRRKLAHTAFGRDHRIESLYFDNFYAGFQGSQLADLGANWTLLEANPYRNFLEAWRSAEGHSSLAQLLLADHKTYLVELLMKQDQMSMAASIESRVPFLDHTFVEFAMQLPDSLKLRSKGKYILKKAVEDLLPNDIIHRSKQGFPTPLRRWLAERRSDFALDYLCDRRGMLASYTDVARLRALFDRHRSGTEDATDRIWRLLNLQLWGDMFFGGGRLRWMGGDVAAPVRSAA